MCCGEAFPSLGVQGVEGLILVGALFPLDGGGEKKRGKKEEKKLLWGRRISLRLELLAGCAGGASFYVQLKADLWVNL
jgi:hypothetical protein